VDAAPSQQPAEGRPQWPAWYGIAAIVAGLLAALMVSLPIIGIFHVAGAKVSNGHSPPALELALTIVQDACWVIAVMAFAAQKARPRAWHFGLRGTRFWPALGWAALALFITLIASAAYVSAFDVKIEQTTLKDLGSGRSALLTAIIGLLVVGVAPVIEEFVFRGFLYGTLRTRFSFLPAAALDGVIFGGIHATTGASAIPPLIVLGSLNFAFAVLTEASQRIGQWSSLSRA
jgi:membrane protease YdiL (CAAX protease family)